MIFIYFKQKTALVYALICIQKYFFSYPPTGNLVAVSSYMYHHHFLSPEPGIFPPSLSLYIYKLESIFRARNNNNNKNNVQLQSGEAAGVGKPAMACVLQV